MSLEIQGSTWIEVDANDPTTGFEITVDAQGTEISRVAVTGLKPPSKTPDERIEIIEQAISIIAGGE